MAQETIDAIRKAETQAAELEARAAQEAEKIVKEAKEKAASGKKSRNPERTGSRRRVPQGSPRPLQRHDGRGRRPGRRTKPGSLPLPWRTEGRSQESRAFLSAATRRITPACPRASVLKKKGGVSFGL